MTLTPEQRAEINRQNAQKSTGPRTEEGKARARRNALRHGLRAETLALPNEDAAAVASRVSDWFDYYQPASPAAVHLTNQCIRQTILSDRIDQFQTAVLNRQVREAEFAFDLDQQDTVEALVALLPNDPDAAVRQLKQSAVGCRYLISRWTELGDRLRAQGFWDVADRDEAIRLQGYSADSRTFSRNPAACLTNLHSLLCHQNPSEKAIQLACHSSAMPISLLRHYRPDHLPTSADARATLLDMVAEQLTWLNARETELHNDFEAPARAEAAQRALIIHDPDLARLVLRYTTECRNAFHRAFKDLTTTLDHDRVAAESDAEPVSPVPVPGPAPAPAPDPESTPAPPNEATPEEPSPPLSNPQNPHPGRVWTAESFETFLASLDAGIRQVE